MRYLRNSITFLFTFFVSSSVLATTYTKEATYYDDMFVGRTTSNGEIFSQEHFSAAICDEGTMWQLLHVSYGNTGMVVKANDRPNCSKHPQVIDLTTEAFATLAPLSKGRLYDLSVSPLGVSLPEWYVKRFLDSDTFSSLGVILAPHTPNTYLVWETIVLKGSISGGASGILYLSHNTTHEEIVDSIAVEKNGTFESVIRPTLPGVYTLILSRGSEFQTDLLETIYVLPEMEASFSGLLRSGVSPSLPRWEVRDGNFGIRGQSDTFSRYTLTQDMNQFSTSGKEFALLWEMPRLTIGRAKLETKSYGISTTFSTDRILARRPRVDTIFIDRKYIDENTVWARVRILRKSISVTFSVPSWKNVGKHWYVSNPDGTVDEFAFPKESLWENGFLITGKLMTITVPTSWAWTYRIETVDDTGVAFFNIPVRVGTVWNIVEPISLAQKMQSRKNLQLIRISSLQSLNTLRASLDLPLLLEDESISLIAQKKAEDMAARDYLGHIDPEGRKIAGKLQDAGIDYTSVWENVAWGSIVSSKSGVTPISDIALADGLELSGSHKYNMIRPDWEKVGIWYATKNGKAYYVQVFVK